MFVVVGIVSVVAVLADVAVVIVVGVEKEKSSSTVGPFVILDNVSSSRSGHLKSLTMAKIGPGQ